ncbi:PREDICTED: tRNA (cytosine(38)-C(5))-methyltransferase [Vollenhovia emeryi]|uniref:tRNA (cytosine(38)-C(5))-methyltransferase n=1 Tax=Vollenhovia emeryi TaxID=411798 RepID=UPI0005F3EF2D|nr:PREDICTED: tRNA (cytosine(38)-C(5))-methyltransferase [Vollenhovia emeryi]XP_011866908.1 PREDICTED: tRNA (cytosine(38)-C(5))-methyltransferase [Vollenhovia emeryi]XP_011866909.1 PREDICTED: tRNA (cytosine(38)-C(5))-methyltransferase [Vollenhovia emeryi]XP_011866910.1 PREDICTED: tRNA (cytosine(38)-C(5))-methyltransferase [Vollenhovia emeryi]XP_011866911.1 PREDICTED: tRNA (cytosine(38)-C(5))-methyltransferase [Vollenhovia emeryi]XP_011866912.1 PREDICTED: tRNA (cytosine(38)-C(5))-methyltransfer
MKVLELYSGIGGMHYALQESGVAARVVAAVDINPVANDVYRHNFPEVALMNRNIQSVTAQELNKLDIDVILMSPPCQPFTRTGLRKDTLDNRTCSLQHILNLIPELRDLKYILLENVRGFETSRMRRELVDCIESCGYTYRELILSPCQFGVPNSRTRYYLLAKRNNLKFRFAQPSLGDEDSPPPESLDSLPKSRHSVLAEKRGKINPRSGRLCYTLASILERVEDPRYLLPPEVLQKRSQVLDIRTSESSGSCCFTKGYGHYVEGTGSVYCPFTDETVLLRYNEVGRETDSDEKTRILADLKLRFFSPKEVCRLMCFPEDFQFPEHITDRQRYRLLGNSINVHVVGRLIHLLCTES